VDEAALTSLVAICKIDQVSTPPLITTFRGIQYGLVLAVDFKRGCLDVLTVSALRCRAGPRVMRQSYVCSFPLPG
jgi:hypothetical protein